MTAGPAPDPPQHERRARGAERGTIIRSLVYVGLLAILCPVSWCGAHQLLARSIPEPPWDAADLGPVPPEDQNGVATLVPATAPRLAPPERALADHVLPLGSAAPEERWLAVAAERARFERYATNPSLAAERERVESSLALPRFADPCTTSRQDCHMLPPVAFARHAAALGIADALSGRWQAAFARGRRLVHAALDYLATARTLLAHAVAMEMARTAVDHLRVVVAGLRTKMGNAAAGDTGALGATTLAEIRAPLGATLAELAALRREDVHAERAVIAEALSTRAFLIDWLDDPHAPTDPDGFAAALLTDRGRTVAWADDYFRALHRHAAAPDRVPAPAFPDPRGRWGWWLWNPGGKSTLASWMVDYTPNIARFESDADALFRSRDALRAEAGPLLQ